MTEEAAKSALTELRLAMAGEGWESEDRITRMGWGEQMGYSIWFQRWDWHGRQTITLVGRAASYHGHTPLVKAEAMLSAAQRAAERARRALAEFPDCPPVQGLDGALQPDLWMRTP